MVGGRPGEITKEVIYCLGITGTKQGITYEQDKVLLKFLRDRLQTGHVGYTFRHGDCVGVDARGAELALALGYYVIAHPPINPKYRAYAISHEVLVEKDYIVRDHDVVEMSLEMVAFPKGFEEELRSGTWASIRWTRKKKKPVTIVWPDGTFITEKNTT